MKLTTYTIFSLMLLLFSFSAKAQDAFSVKGSVVDTTANVKLHNASVLVLRAKDSIMVKFTRANQEGNFTINNLPGGKYLLLVTYPEYADYTESFSLDAAGPVHDFGKLSMILRSKLLEGLTIKATPTAIKIKGDTTVFNASAYVVQPNAKVEDLIKQFPGVTVDKDGKVTANGQAVGKFLVGGEEFFGDDPTLVTKNIRADMVKEIQLYDKRSDQAAFTGIDDGQKTRTMNVVLKEDKKNGYFGKVDAGAGAGNQTFYSGQAMFNKFQNKEKFAFNTTISNNGRTGLSFQDEQRFGDAGTVTMMDGGGIAITISGNDLYYDGNGLPISRSGGLHYDNKWGPKDKYSINTNYKIGQLEVAGGTNTQTQNNLVNSVNSTTSNESFRRESFSQKLDGATVIALDSSASIKITADATKRRTTSSQDFSDVTLTDIYDANGQPTGVNKLLNDQTRTNTTETDQEIVNTSFLYTKKLKKKGRTLSVLLGGRIDKANQEGYLLSENNYYDPATGTTTSSQKTDQFKPVNTRTNSFNSNITFSEPLTKKLSLVFNYGINLGDNTAERLSYDRSAGGEYDVLNTTFSNSFTLNQLAHQGGAIFNYVNGKTTVNFGTRATDVQLKQNNEFTDEVFERHFINWMPQLTYQYRMGTQASLYFSYNGSTSQPNISQLNPVRDNTNPNFQVIGNPDLKPSFSNRFNFSYNFSKALTGQRFYVSGGYSFIENQIVNNQTVDAQGRSTSQNVNMTEKTPYSYNLSATYGQKIWGDVMLQLSPSVSANTSYNMVNGVLNSNKSNTYSGTLGFQKYKAQKYEASVSFTPNYRVIDNTLQKQNANSLNYNGSAYFAYYLPAKFVINSDASYQYTGKTEVLEGFSRTMINASISKMFLKDNTLKVTASVNDLLNQNNGFTRTANGSQIVQRTNTVIRRYLMLTVVWDFNKMGGSSK